MRYARIVSAVKSQPWLITPEAHRSMLWMLEKHLAKSTLDTPTPEAAQRVGFMDTPVESMRMERDTAIIPIKGILARGVSGIEKSCGVCDYEDITTDIDEVINDELVSRVLLHLDTPGGALNGCYEVAAKVEQLAKVKPVCAFTDGQMCSAGYYLAAGATAICATPSSTVGSIGVILQILDDSKAYEAAGLKVETFRSDEFKAVGASGTSLTDAQREFLQGMVDRAAERFKSTVMGHRRMVDEGTLDGRVYDADEAEENGLIDRVVGSIQDAIDMIR